MSRRLPHLALALGVVLVDQVTKAVVVARIPLHTTIPVIPGFFDLTHLKNVGTAFGLLNTPGSPSRALVVTLLAAAVFVGVLVWAWKTPPQERLLSAALALVAGGAVGNLIDRVRIQCVTDFLRFYVSRWEWPSFNVADSAISVGVLLIAWDIWRRPETSAPRPEARA